MTVKEVFKKYDVLEFYERLSKLEDRFEHQYHWQIECYETKIDLESFEKFYNELLFDYNLASSKNYNTAFPILNDDDSNTYSPFLEGAHHLLENYTLPSSVFFENQNDFTKLIIQNILNDNIDLFEDTRVIAENIDWEEYLNFRILNNTSFPSDEDVLRLQELEDVIFSKKIKNKNHHPIQGNTFIRLTGFGIIFSENVYRDLFEDALSISTKKIKQFIVDIINIENNPYMADEEYRDLLMKSDPYYINQSSHLGFAKLNSYLNSIEYFVVLARLY